jgi:hypothetical protein
MDRRHLDRIRLLSARFHELQGLRVAVAGACMALVVGGYVIATPEPTNNGAIAAMLLSFIPVAAFMPRLNRYYATTFGRQVWSPPRRWKVSFLIGYFCVAWWLNAAIPEIPAGGPTGLTVGLFSLWVAFRDWPWRGYYLIPALGVAGGLAASAPVGGLLAPNMTLGVMFLLLGASMLVIGLLDHLLLVKLMKEARESQRLAASALSGERPRP